jgi:AraC-like DNA-binding protein
MGREGNEMTVEGITMTQKGIPEKKRFIRLLDAYGKDQQGFFSGAHEILKDEMGSLVPVIKNMEGEGMGGHEFLSEKIYYCYCYHPNSSAETISISCSSHYLQLFIAIKGHIDIRIPARSYCAIRPNSAQIMHYEDGEVELSVGKDEIEVMVINIHESLIDPAKPYFEHLVGFLQQAHKGGIRTFSPSPVPITQQIRQITYELAQKKYSGCFLSHFIEFKVLELLLLFLSEWMLLRDPGVGASEVDLDTVAQMQKVRDLLLEDLSVTPTLRQLAFGVGTNEFHLKANFKAVFGKTVLAYLRDYRMEVAKTRLIETDDKIVDIAGDLGYKHATHFSAAFKKYHGKLPKDFR